MAPKAIIKECLLKWVSIIGLCNLRGVNCRGIYCRGVYNRGVYGRGYYHRMFIIEFVFIRSVFLVCLLQGVVMIRVSITGKFFL